MDSSLLADCSKELWTTANGLSPVTCGKAPILLGRDLQSKLKEFISPINPFDRSGGMIQRGRPAPLAFFRIMDASFRFLDEQVPEEPDHSLEAVSLGVCY